MLTSSKSSCILLWHNCVRLWMDTFFVSSRFGGTSLSTLYSWDFLLWHMFLYSEHITLINSKKFSEFFCCFFYQDVFPILVIRMFPVHKSFWVVPTSNGKIAKSLFFEENSGTGHTILVYSAGGYIYYLAAFEKQCVLIELCTYCISSAADSST